jgi:hypothetical protein
MRQHPLPEHLADPLLPWERDPDDVPSPSLIPDYLLLGARYWLLVNKQQGTSNEQRWMYH